jgi:hypothetical protein
MKIQPGFKFGKRVLEAHARILEAITARNGEARKPRDLFRMFVALKRSLRIFAINPIL